MALELPTWRVATLLVVALVLARMPKVRTLLAMIAHTAISILLILVERHLVLLPVSFPRTPAAAVRDSESLLDAIMRSGDRLGSLAGKPVDVERAARVGLEPEKEELRAPLEVRASGAERPAARWFMKTGDSTSRGLPLWLTALSGFEGNREVKSPTASRPRLYAGSLGTCLL